jgi:hypothetical protein
MRQPARQLDIAQLTRGVRYTAFPEPCFMKLKLVRGGPWVPAVIWLPCPFIEPIAYEMTPAPEDWCRPTERSRRLRARIGDTEANPYEVWERGRRIDAAEYQWRMALRDWAVDHARAQPEANPRQRVDLASLPSLF